MDKDKAQQYLLDYYNEHGELPKLRDMTLKKGFPFSRNAFTNWFGSKTKFEEMLGLKKSYYTNVQCAQCKKEFVKANREIKITANNFCNRSCSAIYHNSRREPPSEETKKKISDNLQSYHDKRGTSKIEKTCYYCEETYKVSKKRIRTFNFCSVKCSREAYYKDEKYNNYLKPILQQNAITMTKNRKYTRNVRSKNENCMFELCKKHFDAEDVMSNAKIFKGWDADIVIKSLKIAIRWNGIWHYKKIMERHNLEDVQRRDKLKEKAIKECGYEVYTVKDMGRHNKKFVEEQFSIFLEYVEENYKCVDNLLSL